MQIVQNHYTPGKKVENYKEIAEIAKEMIAFTNNGVPKGNYDKAYAIAHNQVSEKPFAMFVFSDSAMKEQKWPAQVIINPQIVGALPTIQVGVDDKGKPDMRQNVVEYSEGCFSFPFRQPKKVKRFFKIKVKYQIKGKLWGMKTIEEEIEGLKAHIFQHEFQHTQGKNIYFEK